MSLTLPELKILILAGGKSTRMGSSKHHLRLPNGLPLYLHLVDILQRAFPETDTIYLSFSQESRSTPKICTAATLPEVPMSRDLVSDVVPESFEGKKLKIIYDLNQNTGKNSAGPAEGLLAAHKFSPRSTWLIVACDFPFLTVDMMQQLRYHYHAPVTCFKNDEEFCEPLLGIWSPGALHSLSDNYKKGLRSPSKMVEELGGTMIRPLSNSGTLLFNANTKKDWEFVIQKFQSQDRSTDDMN